VIGQIATTATASGNASNRLSQPMQMALDLPNSKLYVADFNNNRVLRYAYPITGNFPDAEVVFGQPNFGVSTANNGGRSGATMSGPWALAVDTSGTLYVGEVTNSRVLIFENAHLVSTNGTTATRVLGKTSFTQAPGSASQVLTSSIKGLAYEEGTDRLWVADAGAHRVLRFDDVSTKTSGAPANGVLGQFNFTATTNGIAANKFNDPQGILVTSSTLFVSDPANSRVMRYTGAASLANGANADVVLGQSNFTASASGTAADKMSGPTDVAVDKDGRLYVSQFFTNRVIIFNNGVGASTGASADHIIGQPDFATSAAGTTAARLDRPWGVLVDSVNDVMLVADSFNNRVFVFQASTDLPANVTQWSAE
jgi:sugar lactone lactonase YvrE